MKARPWAMALAFLLGIAVVIALYPAVDHDVGISTVCVEGSVAVCPPEMTSGADPAPALCMCLRDEPKMDKCGMVVDHIGDDAKAKSGDTDESA